MNRSKIVLVQPPIEDFYLTKKRTIPYGLACIAACVRAKGFNVEILDGLSTGKSVIIDYPAEFSYLKSFYPRNDISNFSLFHEFRHFGYSYEHIGTKIREIQPFLVGISSLFTAYGNEALKTAEIIKKFYPQCLIVMGGHHPTFFPEKILDCRAVDFVLRGEGEKSLALLCDALTTGSDPADIPGIAFKKDGSLYISDPSWIKNPDEFSFPAMDLVNHGFYKRHKRYSTLVVSSRGCPMQCSYCSVSASSAYAPFRQRPVKDIVKEIKMQIECRDIGFIDFEDENLCLNKSWFLDLCSRLQPLLEGRDIEMRAMNGLYPPSIDNDIVAAMKALGFKALNLSLGSTSKDQLKRFQRQDVINAYEKALNLARDNDLECVSYLIAAAPGQTADSSLKDLLYLAGKRTLVGLSIYYPSPGSLDFKTLKDLGMLPGSSSLMRSSALPFDDSTSRLEAVTLLRLSRIINFMKHLMDVFGNIPDPEIVPDVSIFPVVNRETVSRKLLQWLLYDGKIRGVTDTGNIYTHLSDDGLVKKCIENLKAIEIKGVR
ncbi:MAG: radical SAM protein [Desulfobacteraceae bacterium]|nr:radical SAM protein [Desulfobacteraceae bacterium]